MISISIRLEEQILKKIEALAKELHLEKSALIRKFVLDGFQTALIERNIRAIKSGDMSIEQAAEDADVSIYQILATARGMDMEIGLDETTLPYEFKSLQKHLKQK